MKGTRLSYCEECESAPCCCEKATKNVKPIPFTLTPGFSLIPIDGLFSSAYAVRLNGERIGTLARLGNNWLTYTMQRFAPPMHFSFDDDGNQAKQEALKWLARSAGVVA